MFDLNVEEYNELVLAPVEFKWRSITLFCSHFLPDPRHQH